MNKRLTTDKDVAGFLLTVLLAVIVLALAGFGLYRLADDQSPPIEAERRRIAGELNSVIPAALADRVNEIVYDRPRLTEPQLVQRIERANLLLTLVRNERAKRLQFVADVESGRIRHRPNEIALEGNVAEMYREGAERILPNLWEAREIMLCAELARDADRWLPGLPALVHDALWRDQDKFRYRNAMYADAFGYTPLDMQGLDPLQVEAARRYWGEAKERRAEWRP